VPGPRILRAYTFVNLGRWREAREDFDVFVQDRTDNQELAFEYAAVLIMAGDTEAYRQLCAGILDYPELRRDEGSSRTKYLAARICALAPDTVPDPSRLVDLAQQTDAEDPGRAWYLHTLGLTQYRADHLDDALRSVEASLAAEPAWEANVINWLLAALIHKRLGHADEAQQWAETAAEWCRSVSQGALPAPGLHVHDRWACLLLQREVEALWQSRRTESPAAAAGDATSPRGTEATERP
jgi:tetratricopeptide (TPR) repeat protein